ncbi:hypothetical protein L9G74_11320 [Shewanella sp. C32]|uniref:SprA-related family protein n=1 Tax=Shewanella electrica TaxID=515560 RepID=A0ABT2FL14_9GAMM|nr:putative metalloprotease CJM1_0395 family protein [Shewanella electrica]MCH1923816.1 hypothetical protein [Shewanella electrica]MCS4557034.1 hypothetical protein [Shewanella electrica]
MLTALSSGNAPTLAAVNVSRRERVAAAAPVTQTTAVTPAVSSPSFTSSQTAHLAAVEHPSSALANGAAESSASGQNRDGLVSLSKGFLGAASLSDAASATETETSAASADTDDSRASADETSEQQQNGTPDPNAAAGPLQPTGPNGVPLSEQELQEVEELSQRDDEVHAHEQAHAAIGGNLAGQPSLEYQQGPDGKRYAVSGEVQIDISVVHGDPEKTMQKMRQVYSAAMAPMEPSGADLRIAADAMRKYNEARQELTDERMTQMKTSASTSASPTAQADRERRGEAPTYNMGIALVMAKLEPQNDANNNQDASANRINELTLPNGSLNSRQYANAAESYNSTSM